MISSTEQFSIFKLEYYSGDIPPPYCYSYQLLIDLKSKKHNTEFEINYHDREELTDEEILEEGFSLNDQYAWKGDLDPAWINEIRNTLEKSSWIQEDQGRNAEDSAIQITVVDQKLKPNEGTPANKNIWEYLMQEVIQAIYEADKLESALTVKYHEVLEGGENETIELNTSFAKRNVDVIKKQNGKTYKQENLAWGFLKEILKIVYSIDFIKPSTNKKLKAGKYLDPGDGYFYAFDNGIKNQNDKSDPLNSIEKTLKEL